MKRALLLSAVTLCLPCSAMAQTAPTATAQAGLDPDAPPQTVHLVDDSEPKTPLVPRAGDLLGSHVLLGGAIGPAWTLGKLGSDVSASHGLGSGLGFRADAGFGLSRTVVLGVWGGYTTYANGSGCNDCAGRALSVGPFLRYQLSQGLRFDPWFTIGGSYRQVSFIDDTNATNKFKGIEWLRLEMGADYYVLSGFGFGPYAALGLSSYSKRPSSAGDASVSTELAFGLRLLLDVPGR
ncbi:MAG TPA: autotransporter outer membrane beta-barrel domain-containing protein [Polyangiaceae bacterium]|nr:autotransporter outer membrane beta-barrel domain-containing protein [Polyangiaceae bacterium]